MNLNSFPPDKVVALKKKIHEHLQEQNIYEQVRDFLADYIKETKSTGILTEEKIMQALQQKGIIDDIVKSLNPPKPPTPPPQSSSPSPSSPSNDISPPPPILPNPHVHVNNNSNNNNFPSLNVALNPTKRYLYLRVMGGRAFVEHLMNQPESIHSASAMLVLHLHMMNTRYKTQPVPCSVEPSFNDHFFFELQQTGSKPIEGPSILQITSPIHMVLTKVFPDGSSSIVGIHSMEWRKVLKTGAVASSVEFGGVGAGPNVTVGILDFRLEIFPKLEKTISDIEISSQIKAERAHRSETLQLFFLNAKAWWSDYVQIRRTHNQRLVKIFAQNEQGIDIPVCAYIQPMRAGRLLDSPRHAARFVSLLPFEKDEAIGSGKQDVWNSVHTFLCKGKGGVEEHSILLCNLLLGFGLDAYVCIGTDDKSAHVWVLTRGSDGKIIFWESLTGVRYEHNMPSPKGTYKYHTVECIFNDKNLYANSQPDDSIARTLFHLEDPALWKKLTPSSISAIRPQPIPPLQPSTLNAGDVEQDLEIVLKNLISEHRKGLGLTTLFDEGMSYLLGPALWAYEQERLTGTSAGLGNDEFQHSIKNAVPEGHTFKGFPIQFVHKSPTRMMLAFLRARACVDILSTRGDQVRFALRVKVSLYPENACAVWVMIACKYIDLS